MKPTDNIGYSIQHLAAIMARQSDQMLQERLGLGYSQFKLLMILERNPKVQQKYVADQLGQTEASISRQIKLMSGEGWLSVSINPKNRREHIAVLTPKGLGLTEEAMKILNLYYAPLLETLGDKKLRKLHDLLEIVHEGVCRPGYASSCKQSKANIWT